MTFRAIAYPVPWRIATAILVAVSRGTPLIFVALLLFLDNCLATSLRLTNPLRLLRAFSVFCLAPALLAWLLARFFAVDVSFDKGLFVLQGRRRRIEIQSEAIEHVEPWLIPLPSGGLSIQLRSGRLGYELQVADPVAFIDALVKTGASPSVRIAARRSAELYARSRGAISPRWYQLILKFVVFALVPALPLFRLHQWISYGGTFGEYYVFGLKAYLLGFGVYWATSIVYLVLYAAVLRAVAEPLVWGVAHVAPSQTTRARWAVELVNRLLYYGGVFLFLLRLYLSS